LIGQIACASLPRQEVSPYGQSRAHSPVHPLSCL
jgi:hypothetical protein